jgi:hypothetical protein
MNKHVFWTTIWPFIVFGAGAGVAGGYGLYLMQQVRRRDARERKAQETLDAERRAGPGR